jgi:hypothetical protein
MIMSDRAQLICMFVLDAIADDYEDLEIISDHVPKLGTRCGLVVLKPEVLKCLKSLIDRGLAAAYRLDKTPPEQFKEMPPPASSRTSARSAHYSLGGVFSRSSA